MKLSHCRNLLLLVSIACLTACAEGNYTIWVSPMNAVIHDHIGGEPSGQDLTIRRDNWIRIQSSKPTVTYDWISIPLSLPAKRIKNLRICYRVAYSQSRIVEVWLVRQTVLSHSNVIYKDDESYLTSTTPTCYNTPGPLLSIPIDGTMTLMFRVRFADVPNVSSHYIDVGAIGILVGP
jgi:hypothetical protein